MNHIQWRVVLNIVSDKYHVWSFCHGYGAFWCSLDCPEESSGIAIPLGTFLCSKIGIRLFLFTESVSANSHRFMVASASTKLGEWLCINSGAHYFLCFISFISLNPWLHIPPFRVESCIGGVYFSCFYQRKVHCRSQRKKIMYDQMSYPKFHDVVW